MNRKFFILGLMGLLLLSLLHACGNNTPSSPNNVPPPTNTFTSTSTPSNTPCGYPSNTCTPTFTFTNTFTSTPTNSPTNTFTFTKTFTPTNTATATSTPTATYTYTPCTGPGGKTCTFTFTATFTFTSTPTNTPTPTNTSTPTATNTPMVPVGIYWNNAVVTWINWSGTASWYVILDMTVNGQPVSTATVVVSGSGVGGTQPVTYSAPTTDTYGSVYARYINSSINYQWGLDYALKSVSAGLTAASTITAPGGVTLASDYSSVYWPVLGNNCNFAGVFVSPCVYPCTCGWRFQTPGTNNCSGVPPVTLTSGYDSCLGSYDLYAEVVSYATTITGASGPSSFSAGQYWKGHNP